MKSCNLELRYLDECKPQEILDLKRKILSIDAHFTSWNEMAPSSRYSTRCALKFVIFLMLCSCIGYFIILNHSGSFNGVHMTINSTVSFIHVNIRFSMSGENASPVIVIFPHSFSKEKALHENYERAVDNLREFLQSTDEFDGAICLQHPSTHNSSENEELNYGQAKTARNIFLESSWCRFTQRNWSVNIRDRSFFKG